MNQKKEANIPLIQTIIEGAPINEELTNNDVSKVVAGVILRMLSAFFIGYYISMFARNNYHLLWIGLLILLVAVAFDKKKFKPVLTKYSHVINDVFVWYSFASLTYTCVVIAYIIEYDPPRYSDTFENLLKGVVFSITFVSQFYVYVNHLYIN